MPMRRTIATFVLVLAATALTAPVRGQAHIIHVPAGGATVPTVVRTAPWPATGPDGGNLQNGAFSPGLGGWTAGQLGGSVQPGSVTSLAGRAQFLEGDSFLVSLSQTFMVPSQAASLSFDVYQIPGFDLSATFIPDAFEASLVDGNLLPVVPPWNPLATSFFNLQETGAMNLGAGVTVNGTRVTVSLAGVPAGLVVTLHFDFIGGDSDTAGGVQIDDVRIQTPPHFDPPSPCGQVLASSVGAPVLVTLAASDLDPLDVVALTVQGLPAWAAFSPSAGNPASGTLSGTPGPGQTGTFPLVFTATDQGGLTDQCAVTLQIAGGAPVFTSPACGAPPIPASVGVQIAVPIVVSDPDPGDIVTLQASGVPAGAVFVPPLAQATGNPAATELRWTPTNPTANVVFTITITATDSQSHVATCSFSIRPAECYLLVGFDSGSYPVGTGGDVLLINPFTSFWYPVLLTDLPTWLLPNSPSWQGLVIHTQVIMYNPLVFPWDPIKMSNGLRHVLGVGATAYGPNSGMSHWTLQTPLLGQPYSVAFAIAGF